MRSMLTTIIQEVAKDLLREEEFSDSYKKMTEFIASKISGKTVELAKMAAQGNKEEIDKFFEKLMATAQAKYGEYISPENFSDAEAKMLNRVSEKGFDVSLRNDAAIFHSPTIGTVTIVKNLYADGKRLHYVAYSGGSEKAKSQAFPVDKRHSLRDLGALLTKLLK